MAQASDGVSEAGSRQFETMSETIQSVQPDRIYISSCAPRELSSHLHRLEDRGKAARAMGAMLTSVYDWDSASVHNESEGGHSDWVHILLSSSFRFDKVRARAPTTADLSFGITSVAGRIYIYAPAHDTLIAMHRMDPCAGT